MTWEELKVIFKTRSLSVNIFARKKASEQTSRSQLKDVNMSAFYFTVEIITGGCLSMVLLTFLFCLILRKQQTLNRLFFIAQMLKGEFSRKSKVSLKERLKLIPTRLEWLFLMSFNENVSESKSGLIEVRDIVKAEST